MRDHLKGITEAYEVEYRIQHKDGHYLWYYDRGVVTKRDEKGMPIVLQGIVFDITETKKIEDRLRFLSERDALTNFYNRRTFFEDLEKRTQQEKTPFSLIMFDVDHFKLINDQHGHLIGDEVLRRLSAYVLTHKHTLDHAYRYGGEEFFLILDNQSLEEAKQIAQDLHQGISKIEMPLIGHMTVSMGVAHHRAHESIDDLVKRVDDLMYEAKRSGRNTIKSEE
jgi:diguanylate cyclase (GGDEF)-like protein